MSALHGVVEEVVNLNVRRAFKEYLLEKVLVAAAVGSVPMQIGVEDPSMLLHDVESIKQEAGAALGFDRKASIKEIDIGLRRRGHAGLAKEVKQVHAGRCAVAHPSFDLHQRVAMALSDPIKNYNFGSSSSDGELRSNEQYLKEPEEPEMKLGLTNDMKMIKRMDVKLIDEDLFESKVEHVATVAFHKLIDPSLLHEATNKLEEQQQIFKQELENVIAEVKSPQAMSKLENEQQIFKQELEKVMNGFESLRTDLLAQNKQLQLQQEVPQKMIDMKMSAIKKESLKFIGEQRMQIRKDIGALDAEVNDLVGELYIVKSVLQLQGPLTEPKMEGKVPTPPPPPGGEAR